MFSLFSSLCSLPWNVLRREHQHSPPTKSMLSRVPRCWHCVHLVPDALDPRRQQLHQLLGLHVGVRPLAAAAGEGVAEGLLAPDGPRPPVTLLRIALGGNSRYTLIEEFLSNFIYESLSLWYLKSRLLISWCKYENVVIHDSILLSMYNDLM